MQIYRQTQLVLYRASASRCRKLDALWQQNVCTIISQHANPEGTFVSVKQPSDSKVCANQEQGRRAIGQADAVAPLIKLLDSAHTKVRSRAVGALHNLSSDSTSIRTIRHCGGIPKLVSLLK